MRLIYSIVLLLCIISSCARDEVIITGNEPPDRTGLANIVYTGYVNKTYIALLGREPEPTELSNALESLKKDDFLEEDRRSFVTSLVNDEAYFQKVYDDARSDYLRGIDTFQIAQRIAIYRDLASVPQLPEVVKAFYIYEIDRMLLLRNMPQELEKGLIKTEDLHRRIVDNNLYDDLNMGTENFVTSVFEHFLYRYPSNAELEEGKSMVDGGNGTLFLEKGDSKQDFTIIFFQSLAYKEGMVRYYFNRFLYREPSGLELAFYTNFLQEKSLIALQIEILIGDEFAGLND